MDLWNTEESNMSAVEEYTKAQYEKDIHFLKAFSSPSGKVVLEWLETHTLDSPTWWPSHDYEKAVAHGFFREGQNSLVRQLKNNIKRAKSYKEK